MHLNVGSLLAIWLAIPIHIFVCFVVVVVAAVFSSAAAAAANSRNINTNTQKCINNVIIFY